MVGAGDVLLMACTWRAPAHPAGDRNTGSRKAMAAQPAAGLTASGPPDCVSPMSVTAAGWRLCAGRILAEFCDLSACGADEFGVF
jgi:hypothetical protein